MPKGDEARVRAAFEAWLTGQGWAVCRERSRGDHADVDAVRPDGQRLLAEVEAATASPGPELDTAYGRLLRRMAVGPAARYALVVPERAEKAAVRVPLEVRRRLGIEVYVVEPDGRVHQSERKRVPVPPATS